MVGRVLPSRDLVVESAAVVRIEDAEIEDLLQRAYVQGGFTDPEQASSMFAAKSVRARGELLVVTDPGDGHLLGLVIVVPPTSPGRRLARDDEAEMQLLAVAPECQGRGIGRALVRATIATAKRLGYPAMVLWTQPTMLAAQHLYVAEGFVRAPERDFRRADGRSFLVFARQTGSMTRAPG
jgi:ribosomal protein S18 acetylase RimI-like enzyme